MLPNYMSRLCSHGTRACALCPALLRVSTEYDHPRFYEVTYTLHSIVNLRLSTHHIGHSMTYFYRWRFRSSVTQGNSTPQVGPLIHDGDTTNVNGKGAGAIVTGRCKRGQMIGSLRTIIMMSKLTVMDHVIRKMTNDIK